ncbi:MAG: O-antigen polysaccharide polymerase Wzy [Bacteroidales bacterium]|nr:O-antigen polysaccharide polymerase Wzy [Bacteroidales bacterium]
MNFLDRNISFFVYAILLIVTLILYILDSEYYDEAGLLFTVSMALVALVVFIFQKEPLFPIRANYFRIIVLFTFSYVIVHFQMYVDLLLKNTTIDYLCNFAAPKSINKGALLSLGGLIALFIGYTIYVPSQKRLKVEPLRRSVIIYPVKWLNIAYVLLFVWFVVQNGADYLAGGYSQESITLREGTAAAYSELLFNVCFYVLLLINCRNSYLKGVKSLWQYISSLGWILNCCLVLYLLLVLFSGDRGPIIYSIAAYFYSYLLATRKKYKLWHFILFFFIAATGITILGVVRSLDNNYSFSSRLLDATRRMEYIQNSISPSTTELAGSVRVLHYAVDYVPQHNPFFDGKFKVREILAVFPFSSSVTNMIFQDPWHEAGSGAFLTWVEQGDNPTSGAGSTVVADLYLDFGMYGVLWGLFLFGLLLRKIDIYLYCIDFNRIPLFYRVLAVFLFSKAIYIPRSSILFELRSIVWIFVVIYFYELIMRKNVRR